MFRDELTLLHNKKGDSQPKIKIVYKNFPTLKKNKIPDKKVLDK